jgi:hypothetical protein
LRMRGDGEESIKVRILSEFSASLSNFVSCYRVRRQYMSGRATKGRQRNTRHNLVGNVVGCKRQVEVKNAVCVNHPLEHKININVV